MIDPIHPDYLLSEGTHAGVRWAVANSGIGYRCGYVRVPDGHPWFGRPRNEIPADAHGGITLCECAGAECWIGFDCGHAFDLPDPNLRLDRPDLAELILGPSDGLEAAYPGRVVVWTQDLVEAECRRLCEQVAAAAGGGP